MQQGLKMARKIGGFCVALLLTLTSVHAAIRELNSIDGLRDCNQFKDTHILELLHWFAHEVEIDQHNVIKWTFDPISGDYGIHQYRNHEGLLEHLPQGYEYYTIGNINQPTSERLQSDSPLHRGRYSENLPDQQICEDQSYTTGNLREHHCRSLPTYVINPPRRNTGSNTARIIIRTNREEIINQVYITRHYDRAENRGSGYDRLSTYSITTNLLRELRTYCTERIQDLDF